MTNKPKHKAWHELNFYLGLFCFIFMFIQKEEIYQFVFFSSFVANIAAAQGLCNKRNIEELYKERGDGCKY